MPRSSDQLALDDYRPWYVIWQQMNWYVKVFVIELNPAELVRLKSLHGSWHARETYNGTWYTPKNAIDSEPPLVRRQKEPLIWRRWDIGVARGYNVAEVYRQADALKARLEQGEKIKPNYERRFKDATRKTKPRKKKNAAGAVKPDHEGTLLRYARAQFKVGREPRT